MNDENEFEVIRGADAIAKAIGMNPRRAYWLLEKGLLPAVKKAKSGPLPVIASADSTAENKPPESNAPVLWDTGASHCRGYMRQ
jgi:hypothetical protein